MNNTKKNKTVTINLDCDKAMDIFLYKSLVFIYFCPF